MAKVVLVIGDTGTGKSTAIKTLDPKETFIFNILNKPLPFKGSSKLYNVTEKNIYVTDSWSKVIDMLVKASEQTTIKNIILDDIGFVATKEFFDRSSEVGFSKFSDIGVHMQKIIEKSKNLREDLNICLMFHEDDDISDKIKIGKKVKLIGQLLEDKYNPLAIVSVCLFTDVSYDKDGKAEYNFITQRTQVRGQTIPAKSPEGMFETPKIPNDLALVFNKMNEYYN